MANVELKVGEIEAMLDLLFAIEKKEQWLGKLVKNKSVHAPYFPNAIRKSITMFSGALPIRTEPLKEIKK